jgi:hypothetical protein
MSVLEEAFNQSTKDLDLGTRRDRVVGFYVRRRATKLVSLNPSWDAARLTTALMGERATIMGYIVRKTDVLVKGPDPQSPNHLDLDELAKITSDSGVIATALRKARANVYIAFRVRWIWEITWRAIAIHDDALWKSLTPPRELEVDALNEIVDRRLRALERMACNVNAPPSMIATGRRTWTVGGPKGPWKDRLLIRIFEYPFLPKAPFKALLGQMPDWRDLGSTILYEPKDGSEPVHLPSAIAGSWTPGHTKGGTIWVTFKPTQSVTPAEVIRRMFDVPREDFLDRAWLFCDQVVAALNIEALWFGRTRRDGNDKAFNSIMNRQNYVSLGPVVQFDGPRDLDTLMADGADDLHFENTEVQFSDLQVGDFVLFWNSRIYTFLTRGAWGNEFSLVMGVDANPTSGRVLEKSNGPQVWLAGHGIDTQLYSGMASELTDHIADLLKNARTRVINMMRANPGITSIDGDRYVRWAPYEPFDDPGAWWIRIPETTWRDGWAYVSSREATQGIPRTIADDPNGGPSYRHPPDADAIYFPLWEPSVSQTGQDGDSWRAYLRIRKADSSFRAPKRLADVKVDGRLAAGLFYRGSTRKIPVVRPRVAP